MKKLPYNVTDKYTGIKFNPTGNVKEEGLHCLSMMVDFCKDELDLDYKFDDKICGDITWSNVNKLFNDNPKEVFKQVEKHFLKYYEKIPPHQMRKGDVVSVDPGNGIKVPCIFVGNNKILITTNKCVKVVNLKGMRIYNVYRIKESKKITTKVVYKMGKNPEDLELIEEEIYDYDGEIAKCETALIILQIIGYVIALIGAIVAYRLSRKLKKTTAAIAAVADAGLQINTRSSKEPLRVVYGLQRVAGNDVYIATTGTTNKYLYIIQTLSEGECDSINQSGGVDQILIDDKAYTTFGSNISYQFYSGNSTQTYDATLHAADSLWTDNLRYTSYIMWRFTYSSTLFKFHNVPTRVLDLKGKKVLDFRNSTTAWSDNGVLCLYDFFTNSRYGLGVDSSKIDETSWTTAANYFDSKGWKFNYVTLNNPNPYAVAQDMMRHFRSTVSWFDGKYYLLIADLNEESSVMTIEDKHIVQDASGKAQINISQPTRFDKPKGIRVSFFDKDKNYVEDSILIGEEDGVVEEISLMGYTDRETVCNLATYELERMKLNRIISGTFRDDCLELAPHDLVTFNSDALGIADQPMRVISTSFAENGLIGLSLQYESLELYDDDYDVDIEDTYTCILPSPNDVSVIQNASMEEDVYYYRLRTFSKLEVTFAVPEDEVFFKHVEVWQAITNLGDSVPDITDYVHQFNTTNDFKIDPVEEAKTYYVILRTVSVYGVKEEMDTATKLSVYVTGQDGPPESLTYLSAIPGDNTLTLFSDKLADPDIEVYEFRLGGVWNGGIFLSAKGSPQETLPGIKPGTHTFTANTKGTNGLYGKLPQSATATISEPTGWVSNTEFTDDYSDSTAKTFINTERFIYGSEPYLKCSHEDTTAGINLVGSYTSEVFDTGVAAALYMMYVECDITVTSAQNTWEGIISTSNTTWDEINITTRNWIDIFIINEASIVKMYIDYKNEIGHSWSTMSNVEILSSISNGSIDNVARYFRVRIEITDPSDEIHAYVENYTLKLYTKV